MGLGQGQWSTRGRCLPPGRVLEKWRRPYLFQGYWELQKQAWQSTMGLRAVLSTFIFTALSPPEHIHNQAWGRAGALHRYQRPRMP